MCNALCLRVYPPPLKNGRYTLVALDKLKLVVSLESSLFLVTQGCNRGFGSPIWHLLGTGGCKRTLTFAIPVHSNSAPISPLLSIPPLPITGFRMKSAYLGGPCHGLSYNPRGFHCLTPFQCLTHF